MTRRERVLKAISHQETDFVPYNFHAVPSVWQKVCQRYGLKDNHEAMEFIGNHIVKVGSDFNYDPWAAEVGRVELTVSGGPVHTDLDEEGGLHRDEFGCLWDRSGSLPHPVAYPLAEKPDDTAELVEALDGYTFPDPYRDGRFDQARELVERYRGQVFLFGKLGMALFERAWSIRGMEQLLMDMVQRPEFVEELLDRILYEWNLPIIEQQLALGVDGFYFADDWGSKTGLIFSPAMWRRFIKPRLAVMYQRCREAGAIVGQHSDGAVGELFPDLIEIGLQVFNPLSPSVMDPRTYKERYGDQLTFYGGIDVERTLPFGTPEEVRQEIRSMAEIMGRGGGYILQSSHTILEDVPLENIVAYIEEVHRLGSTRHDAGLPCGISPIPQGGPPPLMTSEPGSFARFTIVGRKPQIIRQVIEDNDYPPQVMAALEAFKDEISSQPMQPLHEKAPDVAFWNRELAAYQGKTWLEVPWYFAETFFYRRLLEAVRYFQPGPWEKHDPFGKQKRQQEEAAVERAASLIAESWGQLADVRARKRRRKRSGVVFEALLHSCLWGNRADLSNYTVAIQVRGGLAAREERRHILIDHTDEVGELLASGLPRVDFVNDNVGLELLFDLALADFLLVQGMAQRVVFHLKDRPFFVSDAMPKDARATVALLRMAPDAAVRELGAWLHEHLAAERLILKDASFWTSCLMFRQMPPLRTCDEAASLRTELERSNLVILKGDVNYRRLLDDRHWPHTTPLEEVADYFPLPFLVLRTLKGEIMVGLEPGQAEALAAEDPTWLINGKRGIIQLVTKRGI